MENINDQINDQINALEERMYKSEYRIYNAQLPSQL